ncbi:MAG: hypothetical protein OFPI_12000 [Osedax symbiont Rs2]|nr:MAG: hypothetical protein OFPI_12000 [Osedax symbiont Rs2]
MAVDRVVWIALVMRSVSNACRSKISDWPADINRAVNILCGNITTKLARSGFVDDHWLSDK